MPSQAQLHHHHNPHPHRVQVRNRSPVSFSTEPIFTDLSRVYTSQYVSPGHKGSESGSDVTSSYLRKPVDPRPPKSPQFHRPTRATASANQLNQTRSRSSSRGFYHEKPRAGMTVMVDHLQASSPRPKSPKMNNEEPIELSHYPDARKPGPNETPRIERDDFPAPPYPYADPERRRRYSESSKDAKDHRSSSRSKHHHQQRPHSRDTADSANSVNDSEELSSSLTSSTSTSEDPQLKKEEEELSKIATGIGKVFLKEIREREKIRASRLIDPRNASRNPSARKELRSHLRYENPVNASPSRDLDRPKPWDEEDIEMMSVFRSSGGKTAYSTTPAHYTPVSSLRFTPRPGYGTRPVTPVSGTVRSSSPFSQRGVGGGTGSTRPDEYNMSKTHSIDFSSVRSDVDSGRCDELYAGTDAISQCMSNNLSGFYFDPGYYGSARGVAESAGGYRGHSSAAFKAHFRRSMPNVNLHLHTNEPAKLYPYYMLMTSNQKLPPHVDRCHLEVSSTFAFFLLTCIPTPSHLQQQSYSCQNPEASINGGIHGDFPHVKD